MDNRSPKFLKSAGELTKGHFPATVFEKAQKLVETSKVSTSFSKGSLDRYLILSGIIKDNHTRESKITFKKREDHHFFKTLCDCPFWSEEDHCQHSLALFLAFLMSKNEETRVSADFDAPPIALSSQHIVSVLQYGTFIENVGQFQGISGTTFSSSRYLLHNKKTTNFPLPQKLEGTLLFHLGSSSENDRVLNLKFEYRDSEGKVLSKVSIFEHLYLFNWEDGSAYHLPREFSDLMQKIKMRKHRLDINSLIELYQSYNLDNICELYVHGDLFKDIPRRSSVPQVMIEKGETKNQVYLKLSFTDEFNELLSLPSPFKYFCYENGLLSSFKRKMDAVEFLDGLSLHLREAQEDFKNVLLKSNKKNEWLEIINHLNTKDEQLLYSKKHKVFSTYESTNVTTLFFLMVKHFGSSIFRAVHFDSPSQSLIFKSSTTVIFESLSNFYTATRSLGLSLFYENQEVSNWSSRIRFERRMSTNDWFKIEFELTQEDYDIIAKTNIVQGMAITPKGMTILSPEQKNLVKLMQKYTLEEGEEDKLIKDKTKRRFQLPFKRTRIFELFELKKMGIEGALTPEEEALCQKLANLEEIPEYPIPERMEGVLRPYQKVGYNWLRFLWDYKLGACLADDMGLGKTLQTITFIQSIYSEVEHVLIVCPVTILLNWENEFKKFSDIDIHVYHGTERSLPKDKKIYITSYGIMKREIDTSFKDFKFDLFILDEVQHLKNIRSLGAIAARKIEAKFRICLTGTPVENDLSEFYNILDLSVPGIWGDLRFIRRISNKKTRLAARRVSAPFILRRTKANVLTDLPPKEENNVILNFSDEEKAIYVKTLTQIKNNIETSSSKKKYGEILKGLLNLRQRCLWQNLNNQLLSTKIRFLMDTLDQIIEEGHQCIIFSQFTTYLDLIQNELREKHWKIARIDGSQTVKKRQQQVELFQEKGHPVFLISLKAGGVGLNLTAASYVFIMDPWWNPAVESQAIDRAHRIGQQNKLTVFRPIIKNSVEEKVLELQEMKKELFKDLLDDNDETMFTGKLSMKDFEYLLS